MSQAQKQLFTEGQWISPSTNNYFQNINPANDEILIDIVDANHDDIKTANENAHEAFKETRRTTLECGGRHYPF